MNPRIPIVVLASGLALTALPRESRAQHHLWSGRFGDLESQYAVRSVVDAGGNVFVAGFFSGTIDLGAGPHTNSPPSFSVFLAKFNPDGSTRWSRAYEASALIGSLALDVDPSNNVVLGGVFSGVLNGDGPSLMSDGYDGFLVKLGPTGVEEWSRTVGGGGDDGVHDLAVDALGRISITGRFDGVLEIGGAAMPLVGSNDSFVAKLDGNGVGMWSRRLAGDDFLSANAVATDAAGNVAVGGYTSSSQIDLGGGPLSSLGGELDGFVAKLGPTGSHLWSRRVGVGEFDNIVSLSFTDSGDLLAAGEIEWSGWVTRYDAAGAARWTHRNGASAMFVEAIPGTDDAVIWGGFRGVLDFGVGTVTSVGRLRDFFIVRLDPLGNAIWVFDPTGDADHDCGNVSAGPTNLVVCGSFEGDMDLGGGTVSSAGLADAFLGRLSAPLTVCGRGTVNLVNGPAAQVLSVNGEAPFASVATGSPIRVALATSQVGPASAPYVLWIWRRPPTTPLSLVVQSARLGCTENRTPLQGAGPGQPFRCMSGGLPPAVCGSVMTLGNAPSRAPWALNLTQGLSSPGVLTLQALIRDNGAANTPGFSVTNAVVLRVE